MITAEIRVGDLIKFGAQHKAVISIKAGKITDTRRNDYGQDAIGFVCRYICGKVIKGVETNWDTPSNPVPQGVEVWRDGKRIYPKLAKGRSEAVAG